VEGVVSKTCVPDNKTCLPNKGRSSANRTIAGFAALAAGMAIQTSGAFAHGVSDADQAAMVGGSNWDFLMLGARHMITGYDHLLFLFGVMFFLTRFSAIIKFVTAFTIGHTITLITATYLGIQANYFLVDAVIACTVIYKGFDNLDGFRKYLNISSPNLLTAVFVFGLIHGFGLSTRLQQLPILGDGFLLRIISFNAGVELGQIAALAAMLVGLSLWRHTPAFTKFSGLANSGLIVAGCLLLLMQLHGYSHTQYPNEFGFPEEMHTHSHDHGDAAEPEGHHDHGDAAEPEEHHDHGDAAEPEGHNDHGDAAEPEGHHDHGVEADPEGHHTHGDAAEPEGDDAHGVEADPERHHVHDDGTVHADHADDAPNTTPEGQHLHTDGLVHGDHEDASPRFDSDGFIVFDDE
jgi:hypothetical protein